MFPSIGSLGSLIGLLVTQPSLSKEHHGSLTVTAGSTPGFYHYSVPSTDTSAVPQQESGWILVGNPPATFPKSGDKQKAKRGSQISISVTPNPGQSGEARRGGRCCSRPARERYQAEL
jgi:hypothetical protein